MKRKAIFLDRDGVLNDTIVRMGKPRAPYSLEELRLFAGVEEATNRFKNAGYLLIIVTNQPDVARGWVDRSIVEAINHRIVQELRIDDLQVCYHTEKDACLCRKPKPGMLLNARDRWNIDMTLSFMIGDRNSDIEAGQNAGCRTVLVGEGEESGGAFVPDYCASSLLEAAEQILKGI